MIDLHCHLLPGIDDGASSLELSLTMARLAVADGIKTTACTPHIYPGVYDNTGPDIRRRVALLATSLQEAGIPLQVTSGADIQIVPELLDGLHRGRMATLNDSRYFLFEPPHFSVPHAMDRLIADCLRAGYIPVITHPERLHWVTDEYYDWFVDAADAGAWIQVTAGALTGRFGTGVRQLAERFVGDGLVHLLATDAHDDVRRPPLLAEGRRAAERLVGAAEAERLVLHRPQAILDNLDPESVPLPPGLAEATGSEPGGPGLLDSLRRLFSPGGRPGN